MQYILSLDVGTTSLKGVLFDKNGRELAADLQEYELIKPAPDIIEIDCEVYWDSAKKVIKNILDKSNIPPVEIAAVGVTSQGETLTVLDKNGQPLRRSIVWLDNRTDKEAEQIAGEFSVDDVYRITGQQEIIPTWTATRILWIRENEPEVFAKAHKFLLVADYLIYKLTGQYFTDYAINPSTLYFDLIAIKWWQEMLDFLKIDARQLPELKRSGEIAGTIAANAAKETGLSTDTVVTTAPLDQVAGAVGAGNIEPGVITETTGAALAICATVEKPIYDPKKRLGLYNHAVPGEYMLIPWVPTAGMVLRWFRDEFGGERDYNKLCEEAKAAGPGAGGLVMLPHLSGAVSPDVNPKARGVFWGITLSHNRGHFTRAILESIAFVLRGNFELLEELGMSIKQVRSLGGASSSDLWLQIKADVCQKEFLTMQCDEAACLGTAMIAAVATGMYKDLAAATENMVQLKKKITPNPANAKAYDEAYNKYVNLYKNTEHLF